MQIEGSGMSALSAQMRQIRANGGMSRENLTELQSAAQSKGGLASRVAGNLDRVSGAFDSIDSDSNGLLSRAEMKAFAEAEGLERPAFGGRAAGRGGGARGDFFSQLLNDSVDTEDDEEDEEEDQEESTMSSTLKSLNEKRTNSAEPLNLSQAFRDRVIGAYSDTQNLTEDLLKLAT